ncbi:hypothetical protein HPB48_018693 [Haemaphysalis longicornis]|uniref:CCHC-type domain-containing protein n=1 Tax=Haemaphysalis longicornis TaxID=44386 RepID=A0A9J6FNS9_HAELO|nr:hypothetical protein HPB48_018693 [Haemaphysalis longicornis]
MNTRGRRAPRKKLRLKEFVRREGEDDDAGGESDSSNLGPVTSDTEGEDDVQRGVGRSPERAKMNHGRKDHDNTLDMQPSEEMEDANDVTKADADFLTHLLRAQNSGLGLEAPQGLLDAFQRMKGIALMRALRVANLEGQLQGQTQMQQDRAPSKPTYLEALTMKETTRAGARTGSPSQEDKETHPPKVLLVAATDPQAIHPKKVQEYVSRSFDPRAMGLKKVTIRPTTKGVAVIANDEAGLERLASAIAATPATRALNVRQSSERVDAAVEPDTVGSRLLEQNDLEGNTINEGSTTILLVEVSKQISRQLFNKNKVQIGWTVCALNKSPNIPRCSNCARYGHFTRDCLQKEPTCMHCSAPHPTKQCNGSVYDCPACGDHGFSYRDHSMQSYRCPVYRQQVERATRAWV